MRFGLGGWSGETAYHRQNGLYRLVGTGFALAALLTTDVAAQDGASSGGAKLVDVAQSDAGLSQCPAGLFYALRAQSCTVAQRAIDRGFQSDAPHSHQSSTTEPVSTPSAVSADEIPPPQPVIDSTEPDLIVSFEAWKSQQAAANDVDLQAAAEDLDQKEGREGSASQDVQSVQQAADGDLEKVPSELAKSGQQVRHNVTPSDGVIGGIDKKANSRPSKDAKPAAHRYNYASPDCSARIHAASAWSQHASSILHKSKDRYMLTPCAAKEHWVTIELCDEIRIDTVEVGMFEFFSGVVREVVVSVGGASEDDDNEDDDEAGSSRTEWEQVGRFVGRNVRGAQSFTLPKPTSFHRFVRLDFPSFYGSEYYCPISSVKVFGMNQMEAFKWESRRKNQNPPRVTEVVINRNKTTSETIAPDEAHTTPASEPIRLSLQATSMSIAAETPIPSADTSSIASVSTDTSSNPAELSSQAIQTSTSVPHAESPAASSSAATPDTAASTADAALTASTVAPSATKSAETSSSIIATSSVQATRPPGVNRDNARADSSESIYAFIVRRLTALEGNATLATMYIEEQTKVVRELIRKQERQLNEGKVATEKRLQEALADNVSLRCPYPSHLTNHAVTFSERSQLSNFNSSCVVWKSWKQQRRKMGNYFERSCGP